MNELTLAGLANDWFRTGVRCGSKPQAEEKMLVGQVKSLDESRTEIILTDGTRLLTPPGSMVCPGALDEGAPVVAMYREENCDKILTSLSLGHRVPASVSAHDS